MMFAMSGALAQVAVPSAATVPYPDNALRCEVVAGSMTGGFGDARLTQVFAETTRQIVDYLNQELVGNGYDTEQVFTAPAEASITPPKAFVAVARSHCSQMIQVVFHGGQDGQGPFFAYDVNVLHFAKNAAATEAARSVTTVGDWHKDYRYPLTKAQFDTFRTGLFAHVVATDVMGSGVLPKPPAGAAISDAQMRAEYDRRLALAGNTEYHVRQIQFRTQSEAQAALDRIRAGAAFEAVARDVSVDGATKNAGGDIGWRTQLNDTPEIASAIRAAAPHGLVATPVQSPVGWRVLEVIEVRPFIPASFESSRAQLAVSMRRQATVASSQN